MANKTASGIAQPAVNHIFYLCYKVSLLINLINLLFQSKEQGLLLLFRKTLQRQINPHALKGDKRSAIRMGIPSPSLWGKNKERRSMFGKRFTRGPFMNSASKRIQKGNANLVKSMSSAFLATVMARTMFPLFTSLPIFSFYYFSSEISMPSGFPGSPTTQRKIVKCHYQLALECEY